ncbi:hypothetical protein [Spirillospora albida]|uniref:hypothetical protein n=1 Tax=Spirillospora albida TaxID=58123 RepID=UPI0004C29009|nr:hypothetical protein [Spirillospora albida]
MAESPPRSDAQVPAPGDELEASRAIEGGAATAPVPWGSSRPWWLTSDGEGSGAHPAVGTGPHTAVGTGPHPALGTGPHPTAAPVPAGWDGQAPPAASRRPPVLLLGAAAGAVLLLVLVAGVVVLRTGGGEKSGASGGPAASTRRIAAAATAGGLVRGQTPPAATAAYPFVEGAVQAGGVPAAKDGVAVYAQPPAGPMQILFMGGTGRVGEPGAFLARMRPTTVITSAADDPGQGGGKAMCGTFAVLGDVHAYCAWATRDSFGIVASDVPLPDPANARAAELAHLMRAIRRDVEKPRR